MFNTIYNFVTGKSADPISPVIEEDTTLQTTPITKMQEEIDEDVNNEIEKTISDDKDLIFEKGVLLKQKYAKFLFTYKEILEKGTNESEDVYENEDEIIEELTIIKEETEEETETEETETEESETEESETDELTSSVSKWIPREESEESEKAESEKAESEEDESEEDESEEDECVISPNQLPKKVRFQIKKHVLKASIEIEPVE